MHWSLQVYGQCKAAIFANRVQRVERLYKYKCVVRPGKSNKVYIIILSLDLFLVKLKLVLYDEGVPAVSQLALLPHSLVCVQVRLVLCGVCRWDNERTDGHFKILCCLYLVPPMRVSATCPDCPSRTSVDGDEVKRAVSLSLDKFNKESGLANHFGVLKINRAKSGVILQHRIHIKIAQRSRYFARMQLNLLLKSSVA